MSLVRISFELPVCEKPLAGVGAFYLVIIQLTIGNVLAHGFLSFQ